MFNCTQQLNLINQIPTYYLGHNNEFKKKTSNIVLYFMILYIL